MQDFETPLRFTDVDIYYNRVFDLGVLINPIDAARRILRSDYGQAFLNYQTGTFEIADAYKPLVEGYQKLQSLENAYKATTSKPSLFGYLNLLRHSPFEFGKAYINAFKKAFSSSEDVNSTTETDKPTQPDPIHRLEDIKDRFIDDFLELLPLLAIHGHVDHEILSSSYLDNVPFARVSLRPFGATINGHSILFDVTLTIHRSGVAILTAYGGFSGQHSSDEIIKLQRASKLPLQDCEVPAAIMQRYATLYSKANRETPPKFQHNKSGYLKFDADSSGYLGDIFDFYMYCSIEVLHAKRYSSLTGISEAQRDTTWHAYPLVFARTTEPQYPTGAEFKKCHSQSLARFILGFESSSNLKPEVTAKTCGDDLSIVESYSFYMTEGSGTVIYYRSHKLEVPSEDADIEWMRQKFHTTVVVDLILMQRAILSAFNMQLSNVTISIAKLVGLKQQYIIALQELEILGLSQYGSVHEIIKRGHEIFRISDLKKLFDTKMEGIENLIRGIEEDQRAGRERIVKILTSIVTIVFFLNASREFVITVSSFPVVAPLYVPSWLAVGYSGLVTAVQQNPVRVTILIYLTIVCISLFAVWFENLYSKDRQKRVIHHSATAKSTQLTPSPINFTLVPYQEVESNGKNSPTVTTDDN